ncbi:MAG: F0F1 ATP synthase subunit delta [Prevotella sp.]
MNVGVISVRYARALLKAAVGAKLEDTVYHEMNVLAKNFIEVPGLRSTIDNPMLPKDTKQKLLTTALGGNPSQLSSQFVALVLKGNREDFLQFMANSYITLYRQQKNIIRGKLITAVAVSEATEQRMRQMVERKTKGTVEFETEVSPDILGGFVLEYDTYRLDASVHTQLRKMLNHLKK